MTPSPILVRALRWGAILAAAIAVLGAGIGFLVAGLPGLVGGVLGAALAFVFLGLTAASILLAQRVAGPMSPLFFGVVLGSWLLKLILFLVVNIWLRGQDWLDPYVFLVAVVVAVIGSLVVDVLAFQRSRVPYVDVELPGEGDHGDDRGADS